MLPPWLWVGTPLKLFLWLGNRLVTWTGLFLLWRRFRARRSVWVWLALLNVTSLSVLGGLFFWLHHRR